MLLKLIVIVTILSLSFCDENELSEEKVSEEVTEEPEEETTLVIQIHKTLSVDIDNVRRMKKLI